MAFTTFHRAINEVGRKDGEVWQTASGWAGKRGGKTQYGLSDKDKANRCLIGNNDIEFLQMDGDDITYKANTEACQFETFRDRIPENFLPDLFQDPDRKELWTSTEFSTKVCIVPSTAANTQCTQDQVVGNVFNYLVNMHVSRDVKTPKVQVCSQTEQTKLAESCTRKACPLPGWTPTPDACTETYTASGGTFPPVPLLPTAEGTPPRVLQVDLPVTGGPTSVDLQLPGAAAQGVCTDMKDCKLQRYGSWCSLPCHMAFDNSTDDRHPRIMTQTLDFARQMLSKEAYSTPCPDSSAAKK